MPRRKPSPGDQTDGGKERLQFLFFAAPRSSIAKEVSRGGEKTALPPLVRLPQTEEGGRGSDSQTHSSEEFTPRDAHSSGKFTGRDSQLRRVYKRQTRGSRRVAASCGGINGPLLTASTRHPPSLASPLLLFFLIKGIARTRGELVEKVHLRERVRQ